MHGIFCTGFDSNKCCLPSHFTGVSYRALPNSSEAGKCSHTIYQEEYDLGKEMSNSNDSHSLAL